jgi:hypothetical protein
MKLTARQKFIIWMEDHKRLRNLWVRWMARRDRKLANAEFDKVVGNSPVRRLDGSVASVVTPRALAFDQTHTPPRHIEVPLDREG